MVSLTWHVCKYNVHKLHQRYILRKGLSKQIWCLTSTETARLIKDREKGGWRWGKREIGYLSLHCHHQNDSCIKMGSDESHFNVSVQSDGQSPQTTTPQWYIYPIFEAHLVTQVCTGIRQNQFLFQTGHSP